MELATQDRAPSEAASAQAVPHTELHAMIDSLCELVDGTVRCTGPNRDWLEVPGTEGAVQLTARGRHACVRMKDRTARCWGNNEFAQLGDRKGGEPQTAPVKVVLDEIEDIEAGIFHTCARVVGGDVLCWGGKLDSVQIAYDRDPSARREPKRIAGSSSRLVMGHERVYAKTTEGWVTWAPKRARPPASLLLHELDDVVDIASGWADECALTGAGEVRCWGASHPSSFPRAHTPGIAAAIPGLPPITRVTVGRAHACALAVDRRVYCWGELHGYFSAAPSPKVVDGIADVVDLTAGFDFTCARLVDGRVKCWGRTELLPAETAL